MTNLSVSSYCVDFVAGWEGFSEWAYLCPAGVWTIGYGHTHRVKPGDRWSKEHAQKMLRADLVAFGVQVGLAIGDSVTDQQEYDAMVSFAFNVGIGGFRGSSVLRLHRRGDKAGAARSFGLWNKATIDGRLQEVLGLTRRRAAETALYLTPDEVVLPVPTQQVAADEMPQKVAPEKNPAASKTILTTAAAGASVTGIIAENVQPAIDAVKGAAEAVKQAKTSWDAVRDALGVFGNGHVFTVALLAVALAALGYVGWRYWRKAREGEVVIQ